jgi:hypothetical protein
VFGEDPKGCITSGLRFWKGPYEVDRKFAEQVWEVVAGGPEPPEAGGLNGCPVESDDIPS